MIYDQLLSRQTQLRDDCQ